MSSLWFLVCDQRRKKNKSDLFFVVTEAIKWAGANLEKNKRIAKQVSVFLTLNPSNPRPLEPFIFMTP
jgi:hypothetical protein